ncbi:MAG: hypothetical protein ACYC21_06040 [Eubacteriales bacterium]
MVKCKVCGETLAVNEKRRGTCTDCETDISKLIVQKAGQGLYSRKLRLKF